MSFGPPRGRRLAAPSFRSNSAQAFPSPRSESNPAVITNPGGNYQRRRQARQDAGLGRRDAGVGSIGVVNRILVPKPPHAVLGQPVTGGVVAVGSGAHGSLSHRIYQELARDSGTVAVAGLERYGRGQVPSVAVPAARFPLSLFPPTSARAGSPLMEAALSTTHRVAA